jgi:BolA protein
MLAHVIEAQEAIGAGPVEVAGRQRRAELARLAAAGDGAARSRSFHPSMPFARLSRHHVYIGRMSLTSTGPVAAEMIRRLEAHLAPTRMELVDDSEQHRGHGGYNPAGESHFSLTIESAAFIGKSRIERQRMVHAALGDLLNGRVHALSITAREPQP